MSIVGRFTNKALYQVVGELCQELELNPIEVLVAHFEASERKKAQKEAQALNALKN